MPKSKAVVVQLEKGSDRKNYACPSRVVKGFLVNTKESNLFVKPLSQFAVGDSVCNIERKKLEKGFLASAAGSTMKVLEKTAKGTVILGVKARKIEINGTIKAMAGQISCADVLKKPLFKAGIASKIAYAKGKKYPKVSSSRMNVLDSKIGGSYKKKRGLPMTVSRNAPPGRKVGHIAARRTGRKKR